MILQRLNRVDGFSATVVTLMFAFVPVAFCQTASNQEREQVSSETVEEIVVYGEKSLGHLRVEMHRAEEKAYALFNSLNSDDDFDIRCYEEAPTGSRIRRRICRPNFVSEATSEEAQALFRDQPGTSAWAIIQHKNQLLRAEMEALVVARPDFLKAVSEFSDAKKILESERQKRCEGRVFVCRR